MTLSPEGQDYSETIFNVMLPDGDQVLPGLSALESNFLCCSSFPNPFYAGAYRSLAAPVWVAVTWR